MDNDFIDYELLGLKYILYRCEILYDLAMCLQQRGDNNQVNRLIDLASKCLRTDNHRNVINGRPSKDISLFAVPLSFIFEVPARKLKNLDKKEFLKGAKLVADPNNVYGNFSFNGFSGCSILNPLLEQSSTFTTLVRRGTPSQPPDLASIERTAGRDRYNGHSRIVSAPSARNSDKKPVGGRKSSLPTNIHISSSKPIPQEKVVASKKIGNRSENQSGYDEPARAKMHVSSRMPSPQDDSQVKVKIHLKKSTLNLLFYLDVLYESFINDVCKKMNISTPPDMICFPDPDGDDSSPMLTLVDQNDLDLLFSMGRVVHLYVMDLYS